MYAVTVETVVVYTTRHHELAMAHARMLRGQGQLPIVHYIAISVKGA